jgi:hypothetical protein
VKSSRTLVLLAAAAVALCAPLAQAAPSTKPQLTDPSGDALPVPGSYDIVAGQLTTTGITTTRKVGRKVIKTYKPKNLVATLTLTAPPSTQQGSAYTFDADITACGNGYMSFTYTPGAFLGDGSLFVSGCGTDDGTGPAEILDDVVPVVKGNTITWTMPLADMGSDLPLSTVFSNLTASTDLNEPVFGLIGTSVLAPESSIDGASSDATWKLG